MILRTAVTAIAAITAIAFAAPAQGETRVATLVRVTAPGSEKAAGHVAHFLRAELAADERFELVDVAEALGSASAIEAKTELSKAGELLAQGRAAFEALDLDGAVEQLSGAAEIYERQVAGVRDVEPVAATLLLLGGSHLLRGEAKVGGKRFAQALALSPDLEPDPRFFNPKMREAFSQARKAIRRQPTGGILLSSNPAHAETYVDGRFVGTTPLLIPNLTAGSHFVRLVKDSYHDWGELLVVEGGKETAANVDLSSTDKFADFEGMAEESLIAIAKTTDSTTIPAAVARLGALLTVDYLLVCGVERRGEELRLRATLYDLVGGARLAQGERSFAPPTDLAGYDREVAGLYAETLSREALGPLAGAGGVAGVGILEPMCGPFTCRTLRTLLVAGFLGGGVALATVGVALWGTAFGINNDFRGPPGTAQMTDDIDAQIAEGGSLANAGDGLFITGVVLAIAGTVLLVAWDVEAQPEAEVSAGVSLGLSPRADGVAATLRMEF